MPASRSKRTRRQARLEVLLGVVVFVLIQGLAALLVELWFPGWRTPLQASRVEHFRARAAVQGPAGKTVLFLGSSRFQYGIQAGLLERELAEKLQTPVAGFNY